MRRTAHLPVVLLLGVWVRARYARATPLCLTSVVILMMGGSACDAQKNRAGTKPPPRPVATRAEVEQVFSNGPALQQLVESGAVIGYRPATRTISGARSVKFSGMTISDEVLDPLRHVGNLWLVAFHDCAFEAGALETFPRAGEPTQLVFQHCELLPGTLRGLNGSHAVANLTFLHDTRVDDSLLSELTGLPKLFRFETSSPNVSAEGLQFLAECPRLVELVVDRTAIDDAGLAQVVKGHSLTWLDIAATKVTDEGMPKVASLTELKRLRIAGCAVTDCGIASVAGLKKLTALDLGATKLTDDGLAALSELTEIRDLGLQYTSVTNAGLKHLARLRRLQNLDNRGTAISRQGTDHIFGRFFYLSDWK